MPGEPVKPGENPAQKRGLWHRLSGPVKVGLLFATIAIIMALVGIFKGSSTTPITFRSVAMAVLISGGTWGIVSWAIATAVVEVERDVAEAEEAEGEGNPESSKRPAG